MRLGAIRHIDDPTLGTHGTHRHGSGLIRQGVDADRHRIGRRRLRAIAQRETVRTRRRRCGEDGRVQRCHRIAPARPSAQAGDIRGDGRVQLADIHGVRGPGARRDIDDAALAPDRSDRHDIGLVGDGVEAKRHAAVSARSGVEPDRQTADAAGGCAGTEGRALGSGRKGGVADGQGLRAGRRRCGKPDAVHGRDQTVRKRRDCGIQLLIGHRVVALGRVRHVDDLAIDTGADAGSGVADGDRPHPIGDGVVAYGDTLDRCRGRPAAQRDAVAARGRRGISGRETGGAGRRGRQSECPGIGPARIGEIAEGLRADPGRLGTVSHCETVDAGRNGCRRQGGVRRRDRVAARGSDRRLELAEIDRVRPAGSGGHIDDLPLAAHRSDGDRARPVRDGAVADGHAIRCAGGAAGADGNPVQSDDLGPFADRDAVVGVGDAGIAIRGAGDAPRGRNEPGRGGPGPGRRRIGPQRGAVLAAGGAVTSEGGTTDCADQAGRSHRCSVGRA